MEVIDELDDLFFKTSMACMNVNKLIIDLLNDLKAAHYDLGIVTNGIYDPKLKILHMGLSEVFSEDSIFHAEPLGYRKPYPEIYSIAMRFFNKNPKETLFIGDSWTHDVVAPMEMGMGAIWVNAKGLDRATYHNPIAVVSDISEIRPILLNNQ